MLWLYLHFPSLLLDSLSRAQPEQALALAEPRQHQVLAVNALAANNGVAIGQSVATAAILCPTLQVFPGDAVKQQRLLQQLCTALYQYTGDIALQPPDGICIRAGTMLTLYSSFQVYWQQIQQVLQAAGYCAVAACANTPLAARLLARSGQQYLAQDPQKTAALLANTALVYSDLAPHHLQQLARLGISQLGQLLALAPAELARRFPVEVVRYLQRLQGQLHVPLTFYRPADVFQAYLLLPYEITQSDILLKPITGLLHKLQHFLQQRNQLCQRLLLSLFFRQQAPREIQIHAIGGEAQATRWQQLLSLQLETVRLTEPVYALELRALQRVAATPCTGALLQDHGPDPVSNSQLLSVLAARLGRAALQSPALNNSHWPEQRLARQPGLLQESDTVRPPPTTYALRPTLQLAEPVLLTEPVQLLSGAERLASPCWQTGVVRERDYFLARNHTGQQLWVFRTPAQQWFVHGWFS